MARQAFVMVKRDGKSERQVACLGRSSVYGKTIQIRVPVYDGDRIGELTCEAFVMQDGRIRLMAGIRIGTDSRQIDPDLSVVL